MSRAGASCRSGPRRSAAGRPWARRPTDAVPPCTAESARSRAPVHAPGRERSSAAASTSSWMRACGMSRDRRGIDGPRVDEARAAVVRRLVGLVLGASAPAQHRGGLGGDDVPGASERRDSDAHELKVLAGTARAQWASLLRETGRERSTPVDDERDDPGRTRAQEAVHCCARTMRGQEGDPRSAIWS